ncbi:MAG: glycosyltransferase family 4 protein [Clostridia bacterium]|nr:glycosyltransferase family 4 protein [Clostridia bacterium]
MKVLFWMFIGFDRHATSEHLLSAVIERLCEAGHTVHIIQKNSGGDLPAIPPRLSKYDVTTDVIPFQAVDKGNFIARYLTELKYVKACKKHITSDYDAVFIQSTNVAGFAVRQIRKKLPNAIVTFNVQDIFPYNLAYSGGLRKNSLVFKMMAAEQRYGYKHSDHIITISEDMKDTLAADGTPAEKIEVVYNWSYQDEPYEDLDLTPVSHMFDKNFFNVVYAGNIGVMQNVDILIEAAKLMKDRKNVWFHIIGDGQYKDKLQKKADELELTNISFWPMQPPEVAPLIYSAADVNVIPLVKDVYRTALPSKTATCFACGQPIIFAIGKESKFGQLVIREADCFVTESDSPEELSSAIGSLHKGQTTQKTSSFFLKYYKKSMNSLEYAEKIVDRGKRV